MSYIFIFEGGDGSGKTTVKNSVIASLKKSRPTLSIKEFREPGGTIVGEEIRQLLRRPKELSFGAEFNLFWSGRFNLWEREVLKASLQKNNVTIIDRSYPSTYAYQIGGQQADKVTESAHYAQQDFLLHIAEKINPKVQIHYIYLDIDPFVSKSRRMARAGADDIVQFNDDDFQNRVIKAYSVYFNKLAFDIEAGRATGPKQIFHRVDANKSRRAVFNQVNKIFTQVLG